MFEPLLRAAAASGFSLDVTSSRALADSLDQAERADDIYFNKLVRIMATRCMTQVRVTLPKCGVGGLGVEMGLGLGLGLGVGVGGWGCCLWCSCFGGPNPSPNPQRGLRARSRQAAHRACVVQAGISCHVCSSCPTQTPHPHPQPQPQATYFGSGEVAPSEYHHYGLASPIYTHFTSPIRRCARRASDARACSLLQSKALGWPGGCG